MKIQTLLIILGILATEVVSAAPLYDCNSPRPEMAGFHNMVLFGVPGDELYAYHLPLFTGAVNGTSGHVLMHVYQGLWNVQLDPATKAAYDLKFSNERTAMNPFPFFSIGPKGKTFKVPEMICNPKFSLSALAVYGHIESNPDFPQPEKLLNQISTVQVKGEPILARRFDGTAKSVLTYIIFGTSKQYYMAHYLTDDESSFDQIVGIEILDPNLKAAVEKSGVSFVTVPVIAENGLNAITENANQVSPNNKWKLPVSPIGKSVTVSEAKFSVTGKIKVTGEIYFNKNEDLRK